MLEESTAGERTAGPDQGRRQEKRYHSMEKLVSKEKETSTYRWAMDGLPGYLTAG